MFIELNGILYNKRLIGKVYDSTLEKEDGSIVYTAEYELLSGERVICEFNSESERGAAINEFIG